MWCSTTRPRATTRGPRCPSGARQGWGRRLSSGVLHASAVSPQGRWLKRTLRTCAPLAPSAPPGSPGRSPHIPPLQRPGQPSVLHAGAGRAVLQLQVEPRGGTETGAGAGLSWPCPRAPLAAPTCNALLGCHACRLQHPTARPPPPPPPPLRSPPAAAAATPSTVTTLWLVSSSSTACATGWRRCTWMASGGGWAGALL